jgi:serine/threonine protein kinase
LTQAQFLKINGKSLSLLEKVKFFFSESLLELKLFSGTFSEIFLAQSITDPESEPVAIKIQTPNVDSSILRWEIHVLKALQHEQTVPRFISSGMYENSRDYLIMELLTGEVMSDLRNRIRALMPTGLVPVHIASYLARQMLGSLQKLHENHFIHRDVKPSNFVRKNINTTEFVMIDFGLAKLVRFSFRCFFFRLTDVLFYFCLLWLPCSFPIFF